MVPRVRSIRSPPKAIALGQMGYSLDEENYRTKLADCINRRMDTTYRDRLDGRWLLGTLDD